MFFGLISRRERWGLSIAGWALLLATAALAAAGLALMAYPFLAVTQRTDSEILVVEGWVDDHAISVAGAEFKAGGYREIFTTGGPMRFTSPEGSIVATAADLAALRLARAGVPTNRVHPISAPAVTRDRTYASAAALREWLHARGAAIHRLNVVTEDVHARRTRLLFEKALGPGVQVGVIGVPTGEYDPRHWWHYSQGVREVLGEMIGYLYARLFFVPGPSHRVAALSP